MANAAEVVQGYTQALGKGDFASARRYLHDNLSFHGPIDSFDKPEPCLEALKKLHAMVQRIDMKKLFVDGNDVCMLYDLVTNTPAGTSFVAEWYHVKGEKIASIRVVSDARPFAAMFGAGHVRIDSSARRGVVSRTVLTRDLFQFLRDFKRNNIATGSSATTIATRPA